MKGVNMIYSNICTVTLTEQQRLILEDQLSKQNKKRKAKFLKKRLNHVNTPKLTRLFESLQVNYSDKLFDIPMKCHFSFYLYLLLKSRVKFLDWLELPDHYKIAISQDFNIYKLSKETGVCRNTIRKAFEELKELNLIEETDYVVPSHKSTRSILVFNDYYIKAYDAGIKRVLYSSELPMNYYNN